MIFVVVHTPLLTRGFSPGGCVMPKIRKEKKSERFLPFAKGFKLPSKSQCSKAVGSVPKELCKVFNADQSFSPVPRPTDENDWLAQYNEEGQSFQDFMTQCPWLGRRKFRGVDGPFVSDAEHLSERYPGKSISIVPIGEFPPNQAPKLEQLKEYAEAFFGAPVKLLPKIDLTVQCSKAKLTSKVLRSHGKFKQDLKVFEVKARSHQSSGYHQLHATSVLNVLTSIPFPSSLCTIAVTMSDLYVDKSDLFIAGWAKGNSRVACFSFSRYNPQVEFSEEKWYDVAVCAKNTSKKDQYSSFLERCCRLLVHEVSHILGVDHCIYYKCCMNGSGHLKEDFAQPMHLCPVDLHKLQRLFGFDAGKRYQKLLHFYEKYSLKREAEWIRERLALICAP